MYKRVAAGYQNSAHIIETAPQANVLCNAMRKNIWDVYSMTVLTVHVEAAPEAYVWHDRQVGHQIKAACQTLTLNVFWFVFFYLDDNPTSSTSKQSQFVLK